MSEAAVYRALIAAVARRYWSHKWSMLAARHPVASARQEATDHARTLMARAQIIEAAAAAPDARWLPAHWG